MAEKFFDEQEEQSQVKAEIVSKYFWSWAKVIIGTQKRYGRGDRVAYIDLFAGPGRYHDGAVSTPLMILEKALKEPDFCERLVPVFNDQDKNNTGTLSKEIAGLAGIEKLKHAPQIHTGEVGDEMVKMFKSMTLVPTFFFVDPFGYKGLSLELVNSVVKDWGCDCVFFFNYNRINAGIPNPKVVKHMDALFGKERADAMRARFKMEKVPVEEREAYVVEEMTQALKDMGAEYVLPFRFRNEKGTRTSHHLFFVTKAFRGYAIMKDIMHGHSEKEGEFATFQYSPATREQPTLFGYLLPVKLLGAMLLDEFAGQSLKVLEIFERHSVGKPYVLKNYKKVLCELEQHGRIKANPPCPPRRRNTMADEVVVTFPPNK